MLRPDRLDVLDRDKELGLSMTIRENEKTVLGNPVPLTPCRPL